MVNKLVMTDTFSHLQPSVTDAKLYLKYKMDNGAEPSFSTPHTVIFLYQKSFLSQVLQSYECTQCDGYFKQLYFLDQHPGVAIVYFGPGAAYNAAKLEALFAWGVQRCISMGTAGALQKHLQVGDLILCDRAVRDEGVSQHYIAPGRYADSCPKMLETLSSAFEELKYPCHQGVSRTLDTFYRQTASDILQLQKEGVLSVEMEAAALFAVGEHLGMSVGAMFTISDSLADLSWDPYFDHSGTEEGLCKLFEVALFAANSACTLIV
ncbi:MAG: purine-nucleoside phosphorylase [Waddliaceae bacterium]|nr:purine-nucleoside phosphorylase [Waddliaceae bacterium]